jgi:hypothetical protein
MDSSTGDLQMLATIKPEIKKTLIISLGEITARNFGIAVAKLADFILAKKVAENKLDNITDDTKKSTIQEIGKTLAQLNNQIEAFKLGKINETEFDNLFIKATDISLQVKLTPAEINEA